MVSTVTGSQTPKECEHEFTFTDCMYTVGKGEKAKTLVSDISGRVESGLILSIMGPSGAGKTVLMKMLTLEAGPGKAHGSLRLDGQPFTPALYKQHCAFVAQHDSHAAFLTAREHLAISTSLYQHQLGPAERAAAVDELLEHMGLTSCQHTRAGNELVRGLSGGQKRRLSLAVALSKNPALIFLDEPTSGLDAAAAASIMTFLKESASVKRTAILCTIHQPSYKVFSGFDDTLILASGRPAYYGPAAALGEYCDSLGEPVPPGNSPAEHMLELVNKDFRSPEAVGLVLDAFRPTAGPAATHAFSPLPKTNQAPFPRQTWCLLRKLCKLTYKDPTLYLGRAVAFLLANSFFAVVYIRARVVKQEQIVSRMFLTMWLVGVPAALGVVSTFALNGEVQAVRREVRDGMYHPVAYVLAHTSLQLPMMVFLAISAIGVPAYAIADFNASNFVQFTLVYALMLWAFECIAQLCSLLRNLLLGMLGFLNTWFASFLFCGIFLRKTDVIWPFRAFTYLLPLAWAFPSLNYFEFIDYESIGGAEACSNVTEAGCFDVLGANGPPFRCPDLQPQQCLGLTGPQVLVSLGETYEMIDLDVSTAREALISLAIAVGWKLLYTAWLMRQCNETAVPSTRGRGKSAASPEPPARRDASAV
ncbi:hypothetical protein EMIHUDRAFT_117010 [Emiliania huxleyi CCMP1516]|uniref:ABC transporter domain-containing protein n=3 Tax=Emiliania huxleyi TaxID=2903 RepID=A0A0D3JED3_EMIH1|nr:hypothetical protein EMIHUDRAFT_117010 [Emiliania huxleyi CCMP1516]EOD21868.1 hypothetical protein EMIHUDRAFT_117010 [Emiliania huxleyi CCMP1516]|eukprot:XP_005774297.1 hypothetical protein EMIHUDRAFT_117010 [Emiliania huxleyi CCMP1516]